MASLVVLPRAVAETKTTQQFSLRFSLATSVPAIVEVYVDRGREFHPDDRLVTTNPPSDVPLSYDYPLLTGAYRAIRIDPFPAAGSITLENLRIVDRYNNVVQAFSLRTIDVSAFSTITEATDERLVARTERVDPMVIARFEAPRLLWLARADLIRHAGLLLIVTTIVALVTFLLDRVMPHWTMSRLMTVVRRRPTAAMVAAASLGTIVSIYPLLFGRSLVTPNNGPVRFHYASTPYVAGSADVFVENARGQDIPAAMFSTLPLSTVQREALRHGEWPFWNRYAFNGLPLLGQGQSAFFDPLQWLTLIDNLAVGADLKFAAARFVFAAGVGIAALAATASPGAAMFAAFAAPFVGHFEWKVNHPGYFSVVYAPWVLWAFFQLRTASTWRSTARPGVVMLVATALVLFASPPKETLLVLAVIYSTGVIVLLWPPLERQLGRRIATVAIAVTGSALVSAPQWLVFFETLRGAGTLYGEPVVEFGDLTQLAWFLLLPFGIGIIFPGLNPLLTTLTVVLLRTIRHWVRSPCVIAVTLSGGMWLALAYGAIPASWLVRIPFVGNIHHFATSVSSAIAPLFLIVAAAGAASVARRWSVGALEASVLAILLALITTTVLALGVDLASPGLGFALTACIWTGICLYLLFSIARLESSGVGVPVLIGTAGILLVAGGLHFETGSTELDAVLLQPRIRTRLDAVPPEMQPAHASAVPQRVAGAGGVLAGSVPQYQLLETITGVDALFPANTWALGGRFTKLYPMATGDGTDADLTHLAPLLDLWNVGWVFRPAAPPNRLAAIARPSAWPRAFFSPSVERYRDVREFVARLTADPRPFAAVNASDPRASALPLAVSAGITPAESYRLTPNTTSFIVNAPSPGIVVLNENYWPGVSAEVDGQRAEVFEANFTMRGVAIGSTGRHAVTFAYRPQTWDTALLLAGAGALICLGLVVLARRGAAGSDPGDTLH